MRPSPGSKRTWTGDWTAPPVDLWHDRATFHFLTERDDRLRYVKAMRRTLKPGAQAIIATFNLLGPERCSGLPVVRCSADTLAAELGPAFRLLESLPGQHRTGRGHPDVHLQSMGSGWFCGADAGEVSDVSEGVGGAGTRSSSSRLTCRRPDRGGHPKAELRRDRAARCRGPAAAREVGASRSTPPFVTCALSVAPSLR